jgi:hypothetical protein
VGIAFAFSLICVRFSRAPGALTWRAKPLPLKNQRRNSSHFGEAGRDAKQLSPARPTASGFLISGVQLFQEREWASAKNKHADKPYIPKKE